VNSRSPRPHPAHVFRVGKLAIGDVIADEELAFRYRLPDARKGPLAVKKLCRHPHWNTIGVKMYDPIESLFSFRHCHRLIVKETFENFKSNVYGPSAFSQHLPFLRLWEASIPAGDNLPYGVAPQFTSAHRASNARVGREQNGWLLAQWAGL